MVVREKGIERLLRKVAAPLGFRSGGHSIAV
jgi:hypothetical protein